MRLVCYGLGVENLYKTASTRIRSKEGKVKHTTSVLLNDRGCMALPNQLALAPWGEASCAENHDAPRWQ